MKWLRFLLFRFGAFSSRHFTGLESLSLASSKEIKRNKRITVMGNFLMVNFYGFP